MINEAKKDLLEALRARDKSAMSLEELKLFADILKELSEVSDTSSADVLRESMNFMAKTMQDAVAPLSASPGSLGLGFSV